MKVSYGVRGAVVSRSNEIPIAALAVFASAVAILEVGIAGWATTAPADNSIAGGVVPS
jgi:hypothetical protein